ncbi:HlyD family secretion protein [Antarcticirhabdus aurantiaca]|uniref:HlyD family secretion protein n=1 Tax=Antarcticirhabdus aurantiaca TaxID=2606717 RepID=A0ACD4NHI6_9HYPH|nr:HlyD family secretion protein [Antarcticirhabdus aurantiaca]WAJ26305.1 HlyD family secretion protein [Jeongeuplla avenae]
MLDKPDNGPGGASHSEATARARDGEGRDDEARHEDPHTEAPRKKASLLRRHPIWVLLAIVAIVALGVGGWFYWSVALEPYESTDDAFVDARSFPVAPQVAGSVIEANVADNQHVRPGDVLFRIDPRTYQAALDQAVAQVESAKAAIGSADAQIAAQEAQVAEAQAAVAQAEASLRFAEEDAARYQKLAQEGTGTVQTAQQATSNLDQQRATAAKARAAVVSTQKQIGSLQAQKASALADLQRAQAAQEQAQLNLDYTTVTAPQAGRLVQVTGAVGGYAQTGQALAMFVPDQKWVTANFKETQIADMRPGQPAEIHIDAYPEAAIRGRVDSIQPGSGTAFSLLPAENATGNYVKVVQRVPVKIVVDSWPEGVSVGPGMSVVPTVTVRPKD